MEKSETLQKFKNFEVSQKNRFQGGGDGDVNKPRPPFGVGKPPKGSPK